MNRITLLITLMVLLVGGTVEAQRPVGDTVLLGSNREYLYDTLYLNPGDIAGYHPTLNPQPCSRSIYTDMLWDSYSYALRTVLFQSLPEMSWETFNQVYPDLCIHSGGIHITGEEFALTEDLMVVGLAVCPTIYTDSMRFVDHIVDTSIANRLTEYVQLYTLVGGIPQLQAQGPYRWEDPHRYILFPNSKFENSVQPGVTTCVPLYETMFDTSVYIDASKTSSYILAGTCNNNGVVYTDTCNGTIFSEPIICMEHYATAYSCYLSAFGWYPAQHFWLKYDTFPWQSSTLNSYLLDINIFPILDTLFGTPCAMVTGLQTVEVDSLWATLMWSADARHQEWEVKYRPTDDSLGNDSVVTVNVPIVTLTGLTPGTTYSVKVRGLCDACIDNYSPWCDTLQFVTTFTPYIPPDTTPDTLPYIRPHTLGIGNLDRYTRIMPNPAHDVVNVLSSYQLQGVAVYDLMGRQLLEQPADGMTATVNISTLPRGTYILAIRTLQGVATKKLLK